jgi:acylphosphatase
MEVKRVRLLLGGVVQGVGFRYFAKRQADLLGLTGFVRNRWDGRVEVEVEGAPDVLDEYLSTLRAGPRSGRVSQFDVEDMEPVLTDAHFEIRF